ncbi:MULTISPECIES: O-methyltransferase [Halobacteriovorax]|uniref:Methyltransferase domain-containing protein n=1 Tax=Halobacteriovorax vibrionivorans TaxID=2152716 RepID=A0ABY0II77_9BACT|nr:MULTISPECIES: O-methyltransferase [Halobacteriovorax]AYF43588.1 O-methyltransferase [Halobacteriovorax sp. BALOs_7]RZF21843.1 methyltransferase domain-containing protein [Halobacteriovorax vibrionivorans]TGD48323.1 methyltransferase domain-containing protein [Halobacteriovorax sp. Y22]
MENLELVEEYCLKKSNTPSELCVQLGDYTKDKHPLGHMISGELVASLLGFFINLNEYKNILDIGTFTGYSALSMAEFLPEDGKVITIDKNKKINTFAKSYWDKSPHGKKIEALFGDANQVLESLTDQSFDLVFIDADKGSYKNYLEFALKLLSTKGVIVVDNVLRAGRVATDDMPSEDKSVNAIAEFNDYVESRDDLFKTMLPIRDGLYLIQRK